MLSNPGEYQHDERQRGKLMTYDLKQALTCVSWCSPLAGLSITTWSETTTQKCPETSVPLIVLSELGIFRAAGCPADLTGHPPQDSSRISHTSKRKGPAQTLTLCSEDRAYRETPRLTSWLEVGV